MVPWLSDITLSIADRIYVRVRLRSNHLVRVHSGRLTWQWKMDPLKMYFVLNMEIFQCYISLLEGIYISLESPITSWTFPLLFSRRWVNSHIQAPTHRKGPIGRCLPLHGPNLKPWAMTPWMHGTLRGCRSEIGQAKLPPKVSNEERGPNACFGYIGDEILPQLCGDYSKPCKPP